MATKTVWLSPKGGKITKEAWDRLKADNLHAWLLEEFRSDRFAISLTAADRIHTDGTVPSEHWMRFSVRTLNILTTDFEGNAYAEPLHVLDTDASGSYRTEKEATAAYQLFLARYTESSFNAETGRFEEVGNQLNPDTPKPVADSPKAKAADFGSW